MKCLRKRGGTGAARSHLCPLSFHLSLVTQQKDWDVETQQETANVLPLRTGLHIGFFTMACKKEKLVITGHKKKGINPELPHLMAMVLHEARGRKWVHPCKTISPSPHTSTPSPTWAVSQDAPPPSTYTHANWYSCSQPNHPLHSFHA